MESAHVSADLEPSVRGEGSPGGGGTLEEDARSVDDTRGCRKRFGYLSWSDTFMGVASLVAMRSKDPRTQVGACVVNPEHRIVSVGYNGMPNGCHDDLFPWGRGLGVDSDKHLYVCHAETNAVHNRNTSTLAGCTMFVTLFPCNECAKHIVQSGISRVIYLRDKHPEKNTTVAAKRMFNAAGVTFLKFNPSENAASILIDLSGPE